MSKKNKVIGWIVGVIIAIAILICAIIDNIWCKLDVGIVEKEFVYNIIENDYNGEILKKEYYVKEGWYCLSDGEYFWMYKSQVKDVKKKVKKELLTLLDEVESDKNFIRIEYENETESMERYNDGMDIIVKDVTEDMEKRAEQIKKLAYVYHVLDEQDGGYNGVLVKTEEELED